MRAVRIHHDGVVERRVFATPEEAVLHGWPASSQVRVVSVTVVGDRAEVVLDTEPSYPYWSYAVRAADGWRESVSGNGPCVGWDDPDKIHWSIGDVR
jgi:hypothetical protein